MQRIFATRHGPILLAGDLEGPGPLVLVIRGAYATEDQLSRLPEHVAAGAVFGDIPGHRSPWLEDQTLAVCAAAYSEAVDQLGRPMVVCGVSLGGLIALGMRREHPARGGSHRSPVPARRDASDASGRGDGVRTGRQ